MKTIKYIVTLAVLFFGFNSCVDEYTEVFTANSPLYMSYEDLRDAVDYSTARDLEKPGKIYFKDGYIFVNENAEGIHIIDNKNPRDPKNIGFIEIPGNVDMAIKGNILYADSYIDLVAIDISNIAKPKEVHRIEDIFPYITPAPENEDYRIAAVDKEKGVVVGWEIKKIRQEIEYQYTPITFFPRYKNYAMSDAGGYSGNQGAANSFGIGGSMARFGLYDDYLYAVDHATLYMFNVKTPETPGSIGKQNVGWDVETMFIYDGHMFFGTRTGMRIFSLEVPNVPKYVSDFRHVTSCDPVVISDGYAYVTLRGGSECGSTVNRLDVLKLTSNYKNNTLLKSYDLHGPYGLGIDDQILFVCDGEAGLKIYNVEDKMNIDDHKIASFPNIKAYDVIPFNDHLFMIGDDGFYQYDYSNLQNIEQISFIAVKKK